MILLALKRWSKHRSGRPWLDDGYEVFNATVLLQC